MATVTCDDRLTVPLAIHLCNDFVSGGVGRCRFASSTRCSVAPARATT